MRSLYFLVPNKVSLAIFQYDSMITSALLLAITVLNNNNDNNNNNNNDTDNDNDNDNNYNYYDNKLL